GAPRALQAGAAAGAAAGGRRQASHGSFRVPGSQGHLGAHVPQRRHHVPADETAAAQHQHLPARLPHVHTGPPRLGLLSVISVLTEMYDESTLRAMTEEAARYRADPLSPIARRFVLHWGEMGSRWGVNRTVAHVHALLFLAGRPLDAEEFAATLFVARSNVSTSLRELINLNLVRVVHKVGERRDHFETSQDVWELFRTIVRERKAREFDPTLAMLAELAAEPKFGEEPADVRQRIRETQAL